MGYLNYKELIVVFGVSLVIIILLSAFIMVVSRGDIVLITAPVISTNSVYVSELQNVTVFGQCFTPNGTAVLYGAPENHTANVDENGNTSWTYYQTPASSYTIYAIDGNSQSRKSNTITLVPTLHDATLQPSSEPTATPFVGA